MDAEEATAAVNERLEKANERAPLWTREQFDEVLKGDNGPDKVYAELFRSQAGEAHHMQHSEVLVLSNADHVELLRVAQNDVERHDAEREKAAAQVLSVMKEGADLLEMHEKLKALHKEKVAALTKELDSMKQRATSAEQAYEKLRCELPDAVKTKRLEEAQARFEEAQRALQDAESNLSNIA